MSKSETLRIIRDVFVCFSISILLEIILITIESNYLSVFLKANILTILLTLLAINTATLGLIATKIHEILSKYPKLNFDKTIKEMHFSLKEQVFLIILSICVLVIDCSKIVNFVHKELILNALLYAVFFFSIYILWDTGKAVFILINSSTLLETKSDAEEQ